MVERELIIQELWKRLAGVTDVRYTARNPKVPPKVEDLPALQFFELGDTVEKVGRRGGTNYPNFHRRLRVVIEAFINPQAEGSSGKELGLFVQNVKKALFTDGSTLGKLCEIQEVETTRVLRPPVGENIIGIGLVYDLIYVEDVSRLYS